MSIKNCNSTSLIYKSRITILEILSSQGYDVTEYENASLNEVNTMIQNSQLDMFIKKKEMDADTNHVKKVYIRYDLGSKGKGISKQSLKYISEDTDLFNKEYLTQDDNLIIVTAGDNNDTTINLLNTIYLKTGVFIIIHNISRLQFNILNHTIVPKHRIISSNEIDKLKIRYNLTDIKQLPEISRYDPVAQCIGIRPNEVCEIIRPSNTAVTTNYYRICVQ
jgi:DNA-directed RNA polymerase subunit H (RpoH/RPB5)